MIHDEGVHAPFFSVERRCGEYIHAPFFLWNGDVVKMSMHRFFVQRSCGEDIRAPFFFRGKEIW